MGIIKRKPINTAASNSNHIGWEPAPTEFDQRCALVSIWGPTGTGRTALALTAPGPIALAHAGEKIQGVVQAQSGRKPITMLNFGGVFTGSAQDIANQASPIWVRLENGLKSRLADIATRTVVLDTDTEAWELERLAFFGELNPKGRVDSNYGPVNARWRSIFKAQRREAAARVTSPNLIYIGQAKDEYVNVMKDGKKSSERSGKLLQAGQKEVAYNADVVIETSRDMANGDFVATIRKGWFNADTFDGYEFRNADVDFANIMATITGTEVDEWR